MTKERLDPHHRVFISKKALIRYYGEKPKGFQIVKRYVLMTGIKKRINKKRSK